MTASSAPAVLRSFAITRSPEPDRAPQREDLLAAQCAELPARQAPEPERAERDALEALDLDADAGEQAPDLAVLPLGERDRHQRQVAAAPVPRALQDADGAQRRALRAAVARSRIGEEHAFLELRQRLARQRALD